MLDNQRRTTNMRYGDTFAMPIERGVMNAVGQVVPYEWNEWRKRDEK